MLDIAVFVRPRDLGFVATRARSGKLPTGQLPLALPPPYGWGGARDGAGRKPGPRPCVRHRRRDELRRQHPCHVTLRVRDDVPDLRHPRMVLAWKRSLSRACERGDFRVLHFSLQPNHVHLIVEAEDERALARGMMAVGARLARVVNRTFRRRGPVLADRYHLRRLETPREARNALAYVLINTRKHLAERGVPRKRLPSGPDPASSAAWFDGWATTVLPGSPAASCVARARSWLLRVGWRRHGLISPLEVPGVRRRPL